MSWGYPAYLQEAYERRYWEHEAPLLGEMMGFSEGDHSEFVQEIYHYNQKYTHHPIGLIHELRADPAFRHLTLEQLVEAVYSEKHHRQSDCYGFEAIQIDPKATRYSAAIGAGLSCRACDNLIFEGTGLSVQIPRPDQYDTAADFWNPGYPLEERWDFIDNILRKLVDDQRNLYYAVNGSRRNREYALPVFCEDCFAIAQKVPGFTNWSYSTTHTLRQLLAIFEKQSLTKFGANP
jgi:hypothetical protein